MSFLHEAIAAVAASSTMQAGQPQHAIVSASDPVKHLVQVMTQPDGTQSGWIPDPGAAAGSLRIASPCEIGTQVLVVPVQGDAEHPVIVARLFDTLTTPPVSPQTGVAAQPGELLVMAGLDSFSSDTGQSAVSPAVRTAANPDAAWYHLTPSGFFAGAGTMKLAITPEAITLSAGGSTLTWTEASLSAVGAALSTDQDVTAADVSLKSHVHIDAGGTGLSGEPQQ